MWVFRPLPVTTPKFHLSLIWSRDNDSPLRKSFLEILRTRFRKLAVDTEHTAETGSPKLAATFAPKSLLDALALIAEARHEIA